MKEDVYLKQKEEKYLHKKFGFLTIKKIYRDEKKQVRCLCDCGGTIIASTGDLKRGYKKDCGCHYELKQYMLHREFGYLPRFIEDNGKEKWKCRYRCGNKCIVNGSNLRNHHMRSYSK